MKRRRRRRRSKRRKKANQKEKLEKEEREKGRGRGSQSAETKEKERQGRRWLIYFGAAKIWIRVRAPCLKLPTYKLSFIPSPFLSHFLHRRFSTDFSLPPLFDPPSFFAPLPSLFLSLRTASSLIHVYSSAGTWSKRRIEKERSDRALLSAITLSR